MRDSLFLHLWIGFKNIYGLYNTFERKRLFVFKQLQISSKLYSPGYVERWCSYLGSLLFLAPCSEGLFETSSFPILFGGKLGQRSTCASSSPSAASLHVLLPSATACPRPWPPAPVPVHDPALSPSNFLGLLLPQTSFVCDPARDL